MRFFNRLAMISWLPTPGLYGLQVRSEIRFQAKQFVEASLAALDRVEVNYAMMRSSYNLRTLAHSLEAANRAIDRQQQQLKETMYRSQGNSLAAVDLLGIFPTGPGKFDAQ